MIAPTHVTVKAAGLLRRLPSALASVGIVRSVAGRLLSRGQWGAQREVHTGVDRYPRVFEAAAEFARRHVQRPGQRLRILSFGCSTGEECFSLLHYFPDADIDGCDINTGVLAVANARRREGTINFYLSSSEALEKNGPYDLVFCMSSLCMFPDANRPAGEQGKFPFAQFDELVSGIDRVLRPGGLLVAYNTSYAVRMAAVAPRYQAIACDTVVENGFVNKLRRDGKAFTVTEAVNHTRVHRVVNDDPSFVDTDFSDVLFWKRDERDSLPALAISPRVMDPATPIGRYAISDEDVFENRKRLLATTMDVALLRDGAGTLFERVSFARRGLAGAWLPASTYVRRLRPRDAAPASSLSQEAAEPVAPTLA